MWSGSSRVLVFRAPLAGSPKFHEYEIPAPPGPSKVIGVEAQGVVFGENVKIAGGRGFTVIVTVSEFTPQGRVEAK